MAGCSAGDSQSAYQGATATDRAALFDATGSATFPKRVQVGQPTTLRALACGPRAVAEPCSTLTRPADTGTAATARVIKAGARLRADLISAATTVTIVRLGPDVQPVVVRTDQADWEWSITAEEAGTFRVTLIVTVLRTDTNEPLVPSSRLDLAFTAQQSADQVVRSAGHGIVALLAGAASLLAAAGGVAGLAVFRGGRRGRRSGAKPAPDERG